MSDPIIHIESVSQLHQGLGLPAPKHPLITLISVKDVAAIKNARNEKPEPQRYSSELYSIMLKESDCGMLYGRSHYDFEGGVLIFTAPHQVMGTSGEVDPNDNGWMLFFHPDLIRKSHLGQHIDEYTFFSYEANEALHLSDEEEETLEQVISKIQVEYTERIDDFSQRVMVSSLELLLNYCSRFYQRQFNTRTNQSSDVVNQVDGYIKKYFDDQLQLTEGLPSVQYFAEKVNLSANYLSDLLRKETGRALKDHINDFLIDKAKTILLNSNLSVSEIAYDLGFNYPHYFSRLFKAKTGVSPQGYRNLN